MEREQPSELEAEQLRSNVKMKRLDFYLRLRENGIPGPFCAAVKL